MTVTVDMWHDVDKVNNDILVTVYSDVKISEDLLKHWGPVEFWMEVYDANGNKIKESEHIPIAESEKTLSITLVNPDEGVYTAYTKWKTVKTYSYQYQFLLKYEWIGDVEIVEDALRYAQLNDTTMRVYIKVRADFPPKYDEQCLVRIFRDGKLDTRKYFTWEKGLNEKTVTVDITRKDIEDAYKETLAIEVTRETGYEDNATLEVEWKPIGKDTFKGTLGEIPPEMILIFGGIAVAGVFFTLFGGGR